MGMTIGDLKRMIQEEISASDERYSDTADGDTMRAELYIEKLKILDAAIIHMDNTLEKLEALAEFGFSTNIERRAKKILDSVSKIREESFSLRNDVEAILALYEDV